MNPLKNLFEPVMIGGLELKNRLVRPAVETNYGMGDRLLGFYADLAAGGAALIVASGMGMLDSDEHVSRLKELIETVHRHGAKIAVQIVISTMWQRDKNSAFELVGPSNVVVNPRGGVEPRPLAVDEIKRIVSATGEMASRGREAGFDAIEYHAGIGQLINQFISPYTNKRTDEYGGSLENRMRFFLEIIEDTQKRVGDDFPLIARVSGEDFMEGGHTLEDTIKVAPIMERAGINAINVTTGWHEAPVPSFQPSVPRGAWVYMAEGVKTAVNIPVITGTRIPDPVMADEIIAQGKADLVYMARPLIADPELPKKAEQGRSSDIRPCICCSHCFGTVMEGRPMECAVNARIGAERELIVKPATQKKKALIIGGGPAGLEAARIAAARGHHVILIEKKERLGGVLRLGKKPPFKEEIGYLIEYYEHQMKKFGVDVRLGKTATVDAVKEIMPDIVIVAAGADPIIPNIPGVDGAHVHTALDVLEDITRVGQNVVIIGGGSVGCETAEFLADKGKSVVILEQLSRLGGDFERSYRWVVMRRLKESPIKMEADVKVTEISKTGVKGIQDQDGQELFFKCDNIVFAVGMTPNRELADAFDKEKIQFHLIGDCMSPQKIAQAVAAGFRIGFDI